MRTMKVLIVTLIVSLVSACADNKTDSNENSSDIKSEESLVENTSIDEQISQKSFTIGDINVTLSHIKGDGEQFYCKSKLLICNDSIFIDSLVFTPEPVGGSYGISNPYYLENHLVFTKHGDYNGRTIIINDQGQVHNLIGGENFYDSEAKMLFTLYESDLSGLAVFSLENDSLIFEMPQINEQPVSFHKAFGKRYFVIAFDENSEKVYMEIEFDLERLMYVDLNAENLNESNILTTWEYQDVQCNCEE